MKQKSKTALRRKAKAKARQGLYWRDQLPNNSQPTKPTFNTIEELMEAASKPGVPAHLSMTNNEENRAEMSRLYSLREQAKKEAADE